MTTTSQKFFRAVPSPLGIGCPFLVASRLPVDLGSVSTGEGASDWGLGSGGWVQGCDGGCKVRSMGVDSLRTGGVSAVVVAKCSGVFLTNRGEGPLSGDVLLSWRRALWVVPTDVCAVRATWRSMCVHMCMCARVPVQVCGHTYACVYIHVCLCV